MPSTSPGAEEQRIEFHDRLHRRAGARRQHGGEIGDSEKCRLFDRTWRTIREGREATGIQPSRTKTDRAMDFLTMSRSVELYSDDEIKGALLEAAEMIRVLKIMLDAKDEVTRGGIID
jgi:hypothetical protein